MAEFVAVSTGEERMTFEESDCQSRCRALGWNRPSSSFQIWLAYDQPVPFLQIIHLQSALTGNLEPRRSRAQSWIWILLLPSTFSGNNSTSRGGQGGCETRDEAVGAIA